MGFHVCEYCVAQGLNPATSSGDVILKFRSGNSYILPDMVIHYIEDHKWLPPAEFINDVLSSELGHSERQQTRSIQSPTPIGYLSGEYPKGDSPEEFLTKLKKYMNQTGSEYCLRLQSKSVETVYR
ncbi:MAG: hypothetical protein ACRCXZ_03950 [Patescibacteria group bacterium]